MKDMYSFHASQDCALETYEQVSRAYCAIMDQLEVPYVVVRLQT